MLPCKGCGYRRSIPGNTHSRCVFDWQNATDEVKAKLPVNEHGGKTMQWWHFPFNYDPVWGPDECPAFAEEADKTKIAAANPIDDLLSLIT